MGFVPARIHGAFRVRTRPMIVLETTFFLILLLMLAVPIDRCVLKVEIAISQTFRTNTEPLVHPHSLASEFGACSGILCMCRDLHDLKLGRNKTQGNKRVEF